MASCSSPHQSASALAGECGAAPARSPKAPSAPAWCGEGRGGGRLRAHGGRLRAGMPKPCPGEVLDVASGTCHACARGKEPLGTCHACARGKVYTDPATPYLYHPNTRSLDLSTRSRRVCRSVPSHSSCGAGMCRARGSSCSRAAPTGHAPQELPRLLGMQLAGQVLGQHSSCRGCQECHPGPVGGPHRQNDAFVLCHADPHEPCAQQGACSAASSAPQRQGEQSAETLLRASLPEQAPHS